MVPFSPEIPWVLVERGARPYPNDDFEVMCQVCGQAREVYGTELVTAFARAHAEHMAPPGQLGFGDVVARFAKPVARAMGKAPCTPCEARRHAMNRFRLPLPR
jgi:hypothetical protein